MKTLRCVLSLLLLAGLLTAPLLALPQDAAQKEAEIRVLLRTYEQMGRKDFETTWPDGKPKEKYTVASDGTVSYAKFFPAGNYAVKYQRRKDGTLSYERWHGNGQEAVILTRDPRITAWTSYWPSGLPFEKFQANAEKKLRSYVRYDEQGKQVIPRTTP